MFSADGLVLIGPHAGSQASHSCTGMLQAMNDWLETQLDEAVWSAPEALEAEDVA